MKAKSIALLCLLLLLSCDTLRFLTNPAATPGEVRDEALEGGWPIEKFKAADDDYFKDMDGGVGLSPQARKGRNTWIVWTGGNDRLWDVLSRSTFGALDFLKTLSSHPGLKFSRDTRWKYFGLINEPCFEKVAESNPDYRWGLTLDRRSETCKSDPFEDPEKYPGVRVGARGKTLYDKNGIAREFPVGSIYGYATGVVGLRLFPNPKFDEEAARKWDAKRYYEDPTYYLSKDLVKPYRVGMSCAFCHVAFNPVKPPGDPENPKWENLSSNVGAQYYWVDRVFMWEADETSIAYQVIHKSRPGALDTSLISTDYMNNPRTMNAVYNLRSRLHLAKRWGKETLSGGSRNNKQFNDYVKDGPLTEFFNLPDTVWSPRVLKDGSDSVGALGALNRVYLNIGLFSEEWLLHFNAWVGGKRTTPIEIAVAEKNSIYWKATEAQTPDMAQFFLESTAPHKLKDAPGGSRYLTEGAPLVPRGKEVFAEHCARCHSSKIPDPALGVDPGGCSGSGYLDCWNRYWDWTKTDEFKREMKKIVLAPDFLEDNFLSTEMRVPVTLLETNACSPLATNAIAGNIWDNFSSQTYKDLPSVGTITVHHPVTGQQRTFKMPAGGRGYTRPASLVSLWSTAPFLLNNTVGCLNVSENGECQDTKPGAYGYAENPLPTVEVRMRSFQNSIEQMLWPEKREKDSLLGDKVPGIIDRTTRQSYVRVPAGYLPDDLQELLPLMNRFFPWFFGEGGIEFGPVPKGTPVNLLANLELASESPDKDERKRHRKKLIKLLFNAKRDLKDLPQGVSDEEARKVFADLVDPLIELSRCTDFVVNRGHYFGTELSDEDKRALIKFLETM